MGQVHERRVRWGIHQDTPFFICRILVSYGTVDQSICVRPEDVPQELVSYHPDWSHKVVTGRDWTRLLRDRLSRDPRQHDTVNPVQFHHRSLVKVSGFASVRYEGTYSCPIDPELEVQTQVWMVKNVSNLSSPSLRQIYSSNDVIHLLAVRQQQTACPGI